MLTGADVAIALRSKIDHGFNSTYYEIKLCTYGFPFGRTVANCASMEDEFPHQARPFTTFR